ncbi:MAG: hypothetical protein AAB091_01810 [Elusimicrobiota bacterium]
MLKKKFRRRVKPLSLKTFGELLERTVDAIEQRVAGRLKSEFATKEDILALTTKEDIKVLDDKIKVLDDKTESLKSDIKDLKGLIVDRYLEIHGKTHERIERRITKLETIDSL